MFHLIFSWYIRFFWCGITTINPINFVLLWNLIVFSVCTCVSGIYIMSIIKLINSIFCIFTIFIIIGARKTEARLCYLFKLSNRWFRIIYQFEIVSACQQLSPLRFIPLQYGSRRLLLNVKTIFAGQTPVVELTASIFEWQHPPLCMVVVLTGKRTGNILSLSV